MENQWFEIDNLNVFNKETENDVEISVKQEIEVLRRERNFGNAEQYALRSDESIQNTRIDSNLVIEELSKQENELQFQDDPELEDKVAVFSDCIEEETQLQYFKTCQSDCERITMSWTDVETLEFIEAYKKKLILWAPEHGPRYHKTERNEAWIELSVELNRRPEECRKKWEGLMASFRRERAKINRSKMGKAHVSSWYAFEPLQFLLHKNRSRDPLNTTEDSTGTEANSLSQSGLIESEKDNVGENDSEAGFDSSGSEEEGGDRKEKETVGGRIDNKIRGRSQFEEARTKKKRKNEAIASSSVSSRMDDESDIFGSLIAVKLKRYDHVTRTGIQNEILRAFMHADKGSFSDDFNNTHSNQYQ